MKQTSRLALVFLTVALVMVISVATAYWMGVVVIRNSHAVVQIHSAIDSLEETLSTLKDAETGQRGYLLTGDDQHLSPYHSALQRVWGDLDVLKSEAAAGQLPAADVDAFVNLTHEKLSELDQTIQLMQHGQHDAALQIVKTDHGKRLMDRLRALSTGIIVPMELRLNEAHRRMDHSTYMRNAVFGLTGLLNLGFLYWAYKVLRWETAARELASVEVLRQKELIAVTLASIGDAVIVTDTQGGITFLNNVAEKLTGWSSAEAQGKPCASVFRIISEESRELVESPVDKVLKLGLIVGLANHTLLIRRDGSELPIDDSGAPIRDRDGTIRGVVLVFRDFTEHKTAQKTLMAAKADLEAASKAKDQFLANLSHELRTPLTPVLATLTTWEASDELPEAFRGDVQMLRRNIALEARLIDDLLDLTRIVRGKLTLDIEVADVHELLRAVSGMYRSEIHAKEVNLTLKLNATRHFLRADPGRVQQVFWNILKNATKFTRAGGKIHLATSDGLNGQLCITITDTGIGMSPEMLGRLFRPFEQGAEETVRRAGGLGLGMAISKALVDVQGGSISATSDGPGKGSSFTVCFPSVDAPDKPLSNGGVRERASRPHSRLLNILLVEDHVDTARVMARLLTRLGHTVRSSESVAGALELARSGDFDIVLSDIGLPDGTGLDLIRQIKAMKDVPAIALTGFGMDDDIAKCREAGFNAHLTKPVNFQRLEMIIQQVAQRE